MKEGVIWIVPADWEEIAAEDPPHIGFVCGACGMEKCFKMFDYGDGVLTKGIDCTHLLTEQLYSVINRIGEADHAVSTDIAFRKNIWAIHGGCNLAAN